MQGRSCCAVRLESGLLTTAPDRRTLSKFLEAVMVGAMKGAPLHDGSISSGSISISARACNGRFWRGSIGAYRSNACRVTMEKKIHFSCRIALLVCLGNSSPFLACSLNLWSLMTAPRSLGNAVFCVSGFDPVATVRLQSYASLLFCVSVVLYHLRYSTQTCPISVQHRKKHIASTAGPVWPTLSFRSHPS